MVSRITGNVRTPFWMVYHDIESNVNGASWYKSAWKSQSFECLDLYDHILDVIPCQGGRETSWVIQVGAHLGIFPQQGATRGCQAISVEGSKIHIPLIQMTAALNGHVGRHHVIHAAGGSQAGELYFGHDSVFSSLQEVPLTQRLTVERVPVIAVDDMVRNYTKPTDKINIMIIDVEGYENEVLLGAAVTIAARQIFFFNIEVWLRKNNVDISIFTGLELLEKAGYLLYIGRNHPIHNRSNYRPPKPITTRRLAPERSLRKKICSHSLRLGNSSNCLFDLHALHPNLSKEAIFVW